MAPHTLYLPNIPFIAVYKYPLINSFIFSPNLTILPHLQHAIVKFGEQQLSHKGHSPPQAVSSCCKWI